MTALRPEALTSHSKLFALLDEAGKRRIVDVAVDEDVPAGQMVLREGDFGDVFFFLIEGKMSVRIGGVDAASEVASLGTGAFFGEIAALLGEARSATIVALEPSRLARFEVSRVQAILTDYPRVREVLIKLALRRSEVNLEQQMEREMTAEGPALTSSSGDGTPAAKD